jgi:hypothetical protein
VAPTKFPKPLSPGVFENAVLEIKLRRGGKRVPADPGQERLIGDVYLPLPYAAPPQTCRQKVADSNALYQSQPEMAGFNPLHQQQMAGFNATAFAVTGFL